MCMQLSLASSFISLSLDYTFMWDISSLTRLKAKGGGGNESNNGDVDVDDFIRT